MSNLDTFQHSDFEDAPKVSRRELLGGFAAGAGIAALGAAGGAGVTVAVANQELHNLKQQEKLFGDSTISCHGAHQAGVITEPGAHTRLLALRLKPEAQREDLRRLCRILTQDIEALTQGKAPLADPEPELTHKPARLTITVGFGAEFVKRINPGLLPDWLRPIEPFSKDKLQAAYTGGDLLLQLAADDMLTLAHAARMLTRTVRSLAEIHWVQDGFRRSSGTEAAGTTMRNLLGQVDGSINPHPDDPDFARLVWHNSGVFAGGTCMVVRRIRMELDAWDEVDRPGREATIGRSLQTGAPLTGGSEKDPADFNAKNALGLPVIHAAAHIRRAHSTDPDERIYRRSYNYDEGAEQGLLFICYQRDPRTQFSAIQRRLDELDMLNMWVTHTGSAVFAIAPGWEPGGMLGESLFAS